MWNNLSRVLLIGVLLLGALAGYLYRDDSKVRQQRDDLEGSNNELALQARRANEQVAELNQRLEKDIAKISKEKEEELARLAHTHDEMVASLKQEVEAGEITITRLADRLSVNIVDRLLFPSGEADISDDGRKVLERVGKVLEHVKDKTIRIEGHTDNVPIGAALRSRFASNWELSTARATTVARFLQQETKLDPAAFEAVGLGEYHPVASNATAKGRSLNRRIEIILYPRVKALAKELPAGTPGTPPAKATAKP
jgi:chemotaxis protein MotB